MVSDGTWSRVGGLALRAILSAIFLAGAGMKLAATAFEVEGFARFGYAPWFMYAIGVAQLAAGVLLWVRGWTGPAAAFLAVMMVGAVGSHLRAGDPVPTMLPALVLVVILAGLAFARRAEFVGWLRRFGVMAPARA